MPSTETQSQAPPAGRRRRRRRSRTAGKKRPVPLNKRCGSHFQPADRQQGEEYYREERVELAIDGSRACARVEGVQQSQYRVGIDWTQVGAERILHSFCDCQRFAAGRPCKHVWATLLALGESGVENQPPGRDRLSLRKDRASDWPDLGVAASDGQSAGTVQPARPPKTHNAHRAAAPSWRSQLDNVGLAVSRLAGVVEMPPKKSRAEPPPRQIQLLINTLASSTAGALVLDVFGRSPSSSGKLGKLKRAGLDMEQAKQLLLPDGDATDDSTTPLAIIAAVPADPPDRKSKGGKRRGRGPNSAGSVRRLQLPDELLDEVLPHLNHQNMLSCWDGRTLRDPKPVTVDSGPPWAFGLRLEVASAGAARLRGVLERKTDSVPLNAVDLLLLDEDSDQGRILIDGTFARLAISRERDRPWLDLLRQVGKITIPIENLEEALSLLFAMPLLPELDVPEELQLSEVRSAPLPRLMLEQQPAPEFIKPPLLAKLSFEYGAVEVHVEDPRPSIVDWAQRCFLNRDMEAEHKALVRLLELGLHPVESQLDHRLELDPSDLPGVVEPLLTDGWSVEVHGTTVHPPRPPALRVESGIDWFELSGEIEFAGDSFELSEVIQAITRGDHFIELKDGSRGLLPANWLETYDSLSSLAHSSSDAGLRFLPSQALLVDALLTAMPPADVDRAFGELRTKLRSFERIKPKKELKTFRGELRSYQRQGLGWLSFLREFGLGGVLADDMGLGKTVQVLALLLAYRTPAKTTKLPSLVVAPRSVVYNWIEEAKRFTPRLRVVEYWGASREALRTTIGKYDIVVTTYGTLRRDIGHLATVEFDTVILDEAQAIKNPGSQTAKASRLLNARHRLALTGTPIENHLGELGSIFEFLNPGLLGRLPWMDVLNGGRTASRHELELVAEGIRPFILRRTKAQVLPDLPPKTEQVLYCTMGPEQQTLYDQLRAQYQASLLKQVETDGVAGSTIQVLQALLRLRQVACHPGLVDESWEAAGSAKLETLFEQVSEVLDEGHKVIVFSQFTKLLGFVRNKLDADDIPYAYLDGQTRHRGQVVDRFQNDDDCNLFLISLKAGGTGLNLTAAGYVFLLDPWWNPAVEAQAIDRAHRIGQTQPVFAYRLIARDSVEEKILELQSTKRKLADAVLEGEGQSVGDLTADDLRMLLS